MYYYYFKKENLITKKNQSRINFTNLLALLKCINKPVPILFFTTPLISENGNVF